MAQSDLQPCPRCGGTGIDPDPSGQNFSPERYMSTTNAGGVLSQLVSDWIGHKILGALFPKFNARCRLCRGQKQVHIIP